ncbi:MAG: response regulator [candidate division WS1 bacterium]|jgi:DNA-binding NtrC family response regulator|nr:response regulator [candidate division WS1 bacterium]
MESEALPGGPIRVLLVDDEIDEMADTFIRSLGRHGWELETLATVAEARRRLNEPPPIDVVVTDMVMPEGGEGGLQLVEAAHKADPASRIIVLTARSTPATAFASGRRGVRAYVDKLSPVEDPEDRLAFLVPILAKEARRIRQVRHKAQEGALDPESLRAALGMAREARERFSHDLDNLTENAERGRYEAAIGSGREAADACEELLMYLEYFVSESLGDSDDDDELDD